MVGTPKVNSAKLETGVSSPLITRFAPSPTGFLHLGHLAHMIYVWGTAEALGAKVLLRIEDHDRQRSRHEYERAILDDLDWLEFEPANQMTQEFRQSDGAETYRVALDSLVGAYRCTCSRKDLAKHSPLSASGERRYSGHCRGKARPEEADHGIRIPLARGAETFQDEFLGAQAQDPSQQCGDLLVLDRRGNWTYQFAVVVDDIRHGVNLVVRGEDLLASTGRQIRLARLLGDSTKRRWLHHPLITDSAGAKLSKSEQAPPIRSLRDAGVNPSTALGMAAHRVGLLPAPRQTSIGEIAERLLRRLEQRDN